MGKNEYLKRAGQLYALGIQKGYSEEDLLLYTERAFSFLYLTDNSKQKIRCDQIEYTRTDSYNRMEQ